MLHTSGMKDYSSGDLDHGPISLLYRLLSPGAQRIWESGQPCLLKPPTPRHSGLFEVQQSRLYCCTQCLLVSLLARLTLGPEFPLGAIRGNSPFWGVFALIHRSTISLGNIHSTLLTKITHIPSSSV